MHNKILTLGLALALFSTASAQVKEQPVSIKIVNQELNGRRLTLTYDFVNYTPNTYYTVSGEIIDSTYKKHVIESAAGDFGETVVSGTGKKLTVNLDSLHIFSGIHRVTLTPVRYKYKGGPANALLSVALPGLGGNFVYKNKMISPAITIVCVGLIAQSFVLAGKSASSYSDYHNARKQADMDEAYDKAVKYNNQSNTFLVAGAAIWAADVALVFIKGMSNQRTNMRLRKQLTPPATSSVNWNMHAVQANEKPCLAFGISYQF